MVEGKFNDISLTLHLTCGLEIFEMPNKWKSILIGEETKMQGHEHSITCSDTELNYQFTQKLKLVVEGKFNYILLTNTKQDSAV